MPLALPADLTGGKPVLLLSPHPDETLGVGGLIAAACASGERVDVIILTDGSGSHPNSALYPRERLVALRRLEADQAMALLGLPAERVTHLGLADTRAPSHGPVFEGAVDCLSAILDDAGAGSVFVTWERDPHCDHEAAAAMARALRTRYRTLKVWCYPIWGWHLAASTELDEPAPRGFRVDVTPWKKAKHAAMTAHASQMTDLVADDPGGFRFNEGTIAPFLGNYEYFFEMP
jgi:LmbE family N-acetylglucosaminyl deacetylase